MPLISDETGTYTVRPDGTKEYASCGKLAMNDRDAILFDKETGILQLSASPEDCVLFANMYGISENTPQNITLELFEVLYFHKVKQVVSIPKKDGENWFISLKKAEPEKLKQIAPQPTPAAKIPNESEGTEPQSVPLWVLVACWVVMLFVFWKC